MGIGKKILIGLGITVLVIIAALAILLFWRGSTKEILSVANRFQPPASSNLESEMIHPPAFVCLDDGVCPEISRTWKISGNLTKEEFKNLLTQAGWNFPIQQNCKLPADISGTFIGICYADGTADHYDISTALTEDSEPPHQQRLSITIRPTD